MADSESLAALQKRLEEALQRADNAEREHQEQRQRAETERQRAETERQRAETERQRAEKERQKQLKEAVQRADNAEREHQEQRERAEKARQRADALEEETRPTTIEEYITACHTSFFSRFTIETDPKLSSKGSITNPRNKWCPKNLQPWTDFIHEQRLTFGKLNETFPIGSRVFENRHFLAGMGNRISQRRIADEKWLQYFLHNSVKDPVRAIIQQLRGVEMVTAAFEIGDGIVFKNHPHTLSNITEVVRRETLATPWTPDHGRDLNQLRPDQICVTRSNNEPFSSTTTVYISEYKLPCKLTVQHLRIGLRSMDIYKEVVNRKTIPTSVDPEALFRYHAERLTASAITQTYHYMIENGLEYGNLTTGEATVFLKINWSKPETLLYHLAEPKYEVSAHPDSFHICTAVGQYLAFTLMALGSPEEQHEHGQEERQRAMDNLKTWAEDFETILRSIPENERSASSEDSPGYPPTTYDGVERSPYFLRRRRRRPSEPQTDEMSSRRDDRREPSDDESTRPPDTPTPAGRSQRLAVRHRGDSHQQGRQYCTQKCLLGLVRGGPLDPKCPNRALHCNDLFTSVYHPISHSRWIMLLWEQLKRSLDDGITQLAQEGSRGILFKVTLLAYGYTFVAKGTVEAFLSDLSNEAAVYDRLKSIQGRYVPVFLGTIDLRSMNKVYYYKHRVYVVHLTLLSWGGDTLDYISRTSEIEESFQKSAITALRAMHAEGVVHRDVRSPNMVFNREAKNVMMIDLERASFIEPPRPSLAQLGSNKRRQSPEENEGKNALKLTCSTSRASREQDIFDARIVFMDLEFQRKPSLYL